ncbi:glycerate kinase [Pieris rapae]|uniref:glycerate kinase n=1 Tax=Pieris rapae TaxID=64459 RepID=UPI001E27ED03|nr:glycerate kinase [Pieris rapae]
MVKYTLDNLIKIYKTSYTAVLPEILIKKYLKYDPITEQLNVFGNNFNLKNKSVYVIGTGKAVKNMAIEVERMFNSKIKDGYISLPKGSLTKFEFKTNLKYIEGAKDNLPDEDAENTSKKVKSLLSKMSINDFVIVLISGGGSALLSLPKAPITLEQKTTLIKKLANCGADIKELNIVRKATSDLKGGQLALEGQPATIVTLILSDIVGDPLDLIASGPTVENKDSPTAAINIIKKYNLFENLPSSILSVLEDKAPNRPFPHKSVHNYIIGSNKFSIDSAVSQAKELHYLPVALSYTITGNVKDLAQQYYKLLKQICDYLIGHIDFETLKSDVSKLNLPVILDNINVLNTVDFKGDICLIFGGETTVEVTGSGKGGRNQQLPLELSLLLHENKDSLSDHVVYFLSAGTDGIDGPTDAAGAIGYTNLVTDAKKENLDVKTYLTNNDSYNFYKNFRKGELHIITGHTNTNVMDIHLIVLCKQQDQK